MTIRTRLTIWYAGVFFLSGLFVGLFSYYEFVVERRRDLAQDKAAAVLSVPGELVVQREKDVKQNMVDIVEILLLCILPAAVVGLAGGFILTRQALAPISRLTLAAERINEWNLSERLPNSGSGDELDRLIRVFNAMVDRLDQSFQRVRDFTLHASHELKTPLTVLNGELETELQLKDCSAARKERLMDQLDEVQRLARIVDGLILLTKADAGLIKLDRQRLLLNELILDVYEDALILAREEDVRVELLPCEATAIVGDRHRLRQLLLNLADNAIKYNERGGLVRFSLRLDGAMAELLISNTGPGIAEGESQRVFERFFRGSNHGEKSVEGAGLGLSIARWIVQAHGGTIRFLTGPDRMTTVVVRLPRA